MEILWEVYTVSVSLFRGMALSGSTLPVNLLLFSDVFPVYMKKISHYPKAQYFGKEKGAEPFYKIKKKIK